MAAATTKNRLKEIITSHCGTWEFASRTIVTDELEQDRLRCLCDVKTIHAGTLKYTYLGYQVDLTLAMDLENRNHDLRTIFKLKKTFSNTYLYTLLIHQ